MAAIFLVLFFVLSIYGIYISGQSREWYTCYTSQCSEAAAYLKARLQPKGGDACNNFYDFVCHTWSHHRAFAQSFIEDLKDSFWSRLNLTLLSATKPPPPSDSGMHLMYALYSSCYNFMTTRRPVPDRVRSVFEKTNAARWVTGASYAELVRQMIHLALSRGIITVFELKFTKVGDSDLLHISKGSSLRYKATPVTNERIYHDYIKEVLQVIGYKSHLEGSFSYVDAIDRSVEANFAKPSRTKSANFSELGTLDHRASAHTWLERINRDVLQRHWQKEDSEILVTGFDQIKTVMDIVMGGGLRNATAYITVQVVMEVLRYDFFRRYEQQHARDVVIMCLNTTRQFLFYTWPTLVANLTINNTVVEASRKLFDDILDGVVDHMNRAHWLELPSRLEATRKVRNIRLITINPNISDRSVTLSRQVNYTKLSRPPTDFVNSYIEAAQLDTQLRREVGNEEFGFYGRLQLAGDVAYLKLWSLRSGAELFLPTLLSEPPLFYPEAGEPFNYGTLGVLVAMALSNAVGRKGARLSAAGIEENWWTDQTLQNYNEAARCYEEQYRRLSNSTASFLDEQRDQVFLWTRAARIAFDRYRLKYKARITRGRERLQHDRVFFMRLCLLTCTSREEVGDLWPRFRCHMPVLNMREFSEAFSCRTIDLLGADKKCPFL
ncbi:neprilysin-1-like [Dermacentor silvarum]|uniref:neprilysin-1-like n=1 Tax=Dermacentor silvarum TaxID=543639 RepID=UPI002100FD2F|nr:neprilysin-1-like [Dermacentor silvarum]